MSNSSHYSGAAMISVDDAEEIAGSLHGGRPAGSYRRILRQSAHAGRGAEPAHRGHGASGATGGGEPGATGRRPRSVRRPDSAERDKLAVALQRRFEQVYPKRAP